MNKAGKHSWTIATVLFAICLFTFSFPDIVLHPWSNIPNTGGDGGKNLFTYLYHILHGKGVLFTGMNYPYGEHLLYTDAQPLLVMLSKLFGVVTQEQALTVMWYAIALSYVLAMVYTFKTLVHLTVKPLLAMLFAGLICICTPQALRLAGNYSLAYAFVLPMVFYFTLRYHARPLLKYPVFIAITGLIAAFIHPYFSAVSMVFLGSYILGCLLFYKKGLVLRFKHILPIAAAAIIIPGAVAGFLQLTDHITDRPVGPYGMLVYCSSVSNVVAAASSPIWQLVKEQLIDFRLPEPNEGSAYIGLAVVFAVLLSMVFMLVRSMRRKEQQGKTVLHIYQPIWLFIAVLSFLFSMGAPFIWGMEWLLDYVSVMRQFRTLGRFSWIFYYLISVYGAVIISFAWERYREQGKRLVANLILFGALFLWSADAWGFIKHVRHGFDSSRANYKLLSGEEEGNSWVNFLAQHNYKPSSFQSILVLRFYAVGSDKLWLGRDVIHEGMVATFIAGMQLQLPSVDIMMSRTSLEQTQKQVKIAGGPYTEKPMLADLKSDKPFLLLNVDYDKLDPDQSYLLEASDYIGDFQNWHAYACYPGRIRANDRKHHDSVAAILPMISTGDTCIGSTATYYVRHFDTVTASETLMGNGAMPQVPDEVTDFLRIPMKPADSNQHYELSCWYLLGTEDYRSPYFTLEFRDSADNWIGSVDMLTKESTDNHGLWFRGYLFFTLPPHCAQIKCMFHDDKQRSYRIMDELLLRPVNSLFISKAPDGRVLVNNHLYKP